MVCFPQISFLLLNSTKEQREVIFLHIFLKVFLKLQVCFLLKSFEQSFAQRKYTTDTFVTAQLYSTQTKQHYQEIIYPPNTSLDV